MVAVEKVHHVGKGRGCNIVQKPCRSLLCIPGKVPDNGPHAQAVHIARICPAAGKTGEGSILTAAVHPDQSKALQRRRFGKLGQDGMGRGVIAPAQR